MVLPLAALPDGRDPPQVVVFGPAARAQQGVIALLLAGLNERDRGIALAESPQMRWCRSASDRLEIPQRAASPLAVACLGGGVGQFLKECGCPVDHEQLAARLQLLHGCRVMTGA
jgi:hypothetical protein